MKNILSPLDKIEQIKNKIEKLKHQQEKIQISFEEKIISCLRKEKAFTHNFDVLYGAIIDITQKLNDEKNNINHIENWKKLGQKSLNKKNKSVEMNKEKEQKNA